MIKNSLKIIFIFTNLNLFSGPNQSKNSNNFLKNFLITSIATNIYFLKSNNDLYKIIKSIEDKNKQQQIEIYSLNEVLNKNNNEKNDENKNNKNYEKVDPSETGIIFLSGLIGGFKLNNFFK